MDTHSQRVKHISQNICTLSFLSILEGMTCIIWDHSLPNTHNHWVLIKHGWYLFYSILCSLHRNPGTRWWDFLCSTSPSERGKSLYTVQVPVSLPPEMYFWYFHNCCLSQIYHTLIFALLPGWTIAKISHAKFMLPHDHTCDDVAFGWSFVSAILLLLFVKTTKRCTFDVLLEF